MNPGVLLSLVLVGFNATPLRMSAIKRSLSGAVPSARVNRGDDDVLGAPEPGGGGGGGAGVSPHSPELKTVITYEFDSLVALTRLLVRQNHAQSHSQLPESKIDPELISRVFVQFTQVPPITVLSYRSLSRKFHRDCLSAYCRRFRNTNLKHNGSKITCIHF